MYQVVTHRHNAIRARFVALGQVVLGVAACLLATGTARALPLEPGTVFRDYAFVPDGKYLVLSQGTKPVTLAQELDFAEATRAEVIVEIANAHLGYPDMTVAINGHQEHVLPFPERGPKDPSPSLWFHHWYPIVPIALNELRANKNQFAFRVGKLLVDAKYHPAWAPIYGFVVRIYYEPARKPHANVRVAAPAPGAALSDDAIVTAEATSPVSPLDRIELIARYQAFNVEGDGVWDQWHYTLERGRVRRHLATLDAGMQTSARVFATWDTAWVPDQPQPMRIVAQSVDASGLVTVSPSIEGLTLARRNYSVALVRPGGVPPGFTACQYGLFIHQGARQQSLMVAGNVAEAIDARVVWSGWNAPAWRRFRLNETFLDEVVVPHGERSDGYRNVVTTPLSPLAALRSGQNVLATVPGPGRQMDIHWPGVALLIKYAHPPSTATTTAPQTILNNGLGMTLVRIPAGTFTEGTPDGEPGHVWEERATRVEIARPYYLGTTEVTQEQWLRLMPQNPSNFQEKDLPVHNVTWSEAKQFCERLSMREHRRYRLPTEAEWERAARANTTTPFPHGTALTGVQANFDARTPYGTPSAGIFRGRPTLPRTFAPNPWGLFDMIGNVWEWAADWYGEYPKVAEDAPPIKDPHGASEKNRLEASRILRGGAWDSDAVHTRPAFRWRLDPETRLPTVGFRVLLEAGPGE